MKDDGILKLLRKKFPHLVGDYLSKKYAEFEDKNLEELRRERPELFDEEGKFKGSLSTNAIEGGNWRLKYELRTAYSLQESISGRMNLIALKESLYTFKNGKPNESWAHKHSEFQLEDVMSIKLEKTACLTHRTPKNRWGETPMDGVDELIEDPVARSLPAEM
ncbi:hypothetical protein AKJ37_05810 [candidate division MSBL1 archaeon SCGC-AAA259I09]|uniref:Uncharacterized protein n=1 Tax=candidate division MSBL1 archaeon SCGC-AAA259I09 TaxID=1698267 RepID=A0A133UPQ1_9EURY|nr:hypothetical protein AKJ37_05810 [candidate division MSBL1 archaeon SCGC-AAA259I09]